MFISNVKTWYWYLYNYANEYNWIVQKLLTNREIGIVLSDNHYV